MPLDEREMSSFGFIKRFEFNVYGERKPALFETTAFL